MQYFLDHLVQVYKIYRLYRQASFMSYLKITLNSFSRWPSYWHFVTAPTISHWICRIWELNEFNLNLFSLVALKRAVFTLARSYCSLSRCSKCPTSAPTHDCSRFRQERIAFCIGVCGNASQMFSNAPLSSEHEVGLVLSLLYILL